MAADRCGDKHGAATTGFTSPVAPPRARTSLIAHFFVRQGQGSAIVLVRSGVSALGHAARMHLFAVDANRFWRFNAKTDLRSFNGDHGHDDLARNDNLFTSMSGQH